MDRQDHCSPTMEAAETTQPGDDVKNMANNTAADDVFHEEDPEGSEGLDPRIQVSNQFNNYKETL